MDARPLSFSFWLSIYHSWFAWEYGWIRWPWIAREAKEQYELASLVFALGWKISKACAYISILYIIKISWKHTKEPNKNKKETFPPNPRTLSKEWCATVLLHCFTKRVQLPHRKRYSTHIEETSLEIKLLSLSSCVKMVQRWNDGWAKIWRTPTSCLEKQ